MAGDKQTIGVLAGGAPLLDRDPMAKMIRLGRTIGDKEPTYGAHLYDQESIHAVDLGSGVMEDDQL